MPDYGRRCAGSCRPRQEARSSDLDRETSANPPLSSSSFACQNSAAPLAAKETSSLAGMAPFLLASQAASLARPMWRAAAPESGKALFAGSPSRLPAMEQGPDRPLPAPHREGHAPHRRRHRLHPQTRHLRKHRARQRHPVDSAKLIVASPVNGRRRAHSRPQVTGLTGAYRLRSAIS